MQHWVQHFLKNYKISPPGWNNFAHNSILSSVEAVFLCMNLLAPPGTADFRRKKGQISEGGGGGGTSNQPLILATVFIKVLKAFAFVYVQRQDTWQRNRSFVVEVAVNNNYYCEQ